MIYKVDNAVIMAAGISSRFVPISLEKPKALLTVKGEVLIERQIRQLREAGIGQIIVVVGYKKEQFEYLKEQFGVTLIENPEYDSRNNNGSLYAARNFIKNTYICSADNYFSRNPFTAQNPESYYAAVYAQGQTEEWCLTEDAQGYITGVTVGGQDAWHMLGHAFFTEAFSRKFLSILTEEYDMPPTRDKLWEAIYMEHLAELPMQIKKYPQEEIHEFDSLDELRQFDEKYLENTGSAILHRIAVSLACSESRIRRITPILDAKGKAEGMRFLCGETPHEYYFPEQMLTPEERSLVLQVLHLSENDFINVTTLKTGMTNHSFLLECNRKKYIMRIPGEGTGHMINRAAEAAVYSIIRDRQLSDHIIYINPGNGYKISEYIEGARVCDPTSEADVAACMRFLRNFHGMGLVADHEFDLFGQIDFYESLWKGEASVYEDYSQTKQNVFALKQYLDSLEIDKALTHIDAVNDNFLIYQSKDGRETIRLIDWEYAGMQDPHVDIAMFCIYALYDKAQIDRTIHLYFEDTWEEDTSVKIYCYIAICGLLWSNWCEYKKRLGIEFGGYALKQYQYAKEYCGIAQTQIRRQRKEHGNTNE